MRFKDFHINIKIRIYEAFISTFVGSMIFPFMAIYLAQHFGAKMAGILLLINVLVGIGINFFGGYFSDQYGRKKLMIIAEVLHFVTLATMAFCNSPWFTSATITFFMMTLGSIAWGIGGPANQAMLIDVSLPEQRKTMYSIMYWANNLSIAIGGILGGFLFKEYLFYLFLALAVAALGALFLLIFFIEESYFPNKDQIEKKDSRNHALEMIKSYKLVLKDRILVLFVLAGTLVLSMEFQLTNYISIRLADEFEIQKLFFWEIDGIQALAFLRTENTLLVVIMALFAVKLVEKMNDRFVLIATCFVFVIGYGVISYSKNIWLLFAMMFIATVGEVLRVPVQQNYMSTLPPQDARSSYMAVQGLTYNVSTLICSVTVTLSAFISSFWTTIFISVIGLAGVFIYILISPKLEARLKIATEESSTTLGA